MERLTVEDVGCWVLKSARPLDVLVDGWAPGTARVLTRCVRRSYRLDLLDVGQPALLWVSGRDDPGVHALGEVTGPVYEDQDDGPAVELRLTRLVAPVPRSSLLADEVVRDAEVLRMPAGSNPSWLSPAQYAVVLAESGRSPHP